MMVECNGVTMGGLCNKICLERKTYMIVNKDIEWLKDNSAD